MTRMLAVLAMFFVAVTPALIYPTVVHSLAQGRHAMSLVIGGTILRSNTTRHDQLRPGEFPVYLETNAIRGISEKSHVIIESGNIHV